MSSNNIQNPFKTKRLSLKELRKRFRSKKNVIEHYHNKGILKSLIFFFLILLYLEEIFLNMIK